MKLKEAIGVFKQNVALFLGGDFDAVMQQPKFDLSKLNIKETDPKTYEQNALKAAWNLCLELEKGITNQIDLNELQKLQKVLDRGENTFAPSVDIEWTDTVFKLSNAYTNFLGEMLAEQNNDPLELPGDLKFKLKMAITLFQKDMFEKFIPRVVDVIARGQENYNYKKEDAKEKASTQSTPSNISDTPPVSSAESSTASSDDEIAPPPRPVTPPVQAATPYDPLHDRYVAILKSYYEFMTDSKTLTTMHQHNTQLTKIRALKTDLDSIKSELTKLAPMDKSQERKFIQGPSGAGVQLDTLSSRLNENENKLAYIVAMMGISEKCNHLPALNVVNTKKDSKELVDKCTLILDEINKAKNQQANIKESDMTIKLDLDNIQKDVMSARTQAQHKLDGFELTDKYFGDQQSKFESYLEERKKKYLTRDTLGKVAGKVTGSLFKPEKDERETYLRTQLYTAMKDYVVAGSDAKQQAYDDLQLVIAKGEKFKSRSAQKEGVSLQSELADFKKEVLNLQAQFDKLNPPAAENSHELK